MKLTYAAAVLCALASPLAAEEIKNPLTEGATWIDLRGDVVGDAQITESQTLFTVDAPYRAHDAATVPIVIHQADTSVPITAATVVVDENPAPVAGRFEFGPSMGPIDFELRVRVNQYSNVRVLAETPEGYVMNGRYVKASGGCSAPATRDPELALASMGQMKLRLFGDAPAMSQARREAQIMIRHPNYSGLQRDQVTQLFINAHFIDTIEVRQGEDLLFTMEGGISISENPVFRFSYNDNGSETLTVRATDTEGNIFERELSKVAES